MLPVDVDSPGAQATLTFGQLIEGIPATIDPRIDGEEVAKLSTGSSMALALDTFLLMLESCCKIIARCPSAVLQDVAFESTPADMSKLVSSLSLTDALPMHLSRSDMNPHDASISDSSMSLYAVAEFVREPKDPTSSATESQPERKAKWQEIALDMAKAISNVRMQIQTPAYGGTTEQELVEAVEYADGFRIGFQDSHRAAMARIRHCLVMDVPSAALYYEAMQSVKRLQNLSRCLTVGSKTLITILENRRKSRNVKLGTVMGTAALTTAAVLTTAATTMLPALVVVSAAYAGVGVTAATAPYLTLKWFEESPQGEKLKQAQQHIDKVHQTLFEQIVACFVTRAWGMNLQTLSPADREKTLKGFGLEQNYFDTYEYNEAKLRGALEEVENAHDSLIDDSSSKATVICYRGGTDIKRARLLNTVLSPTHVIARTAYAE
ncbi:hypothetical protein yc1106_06732 [Curvularia clavata]|uniref:Uncharacterized protein n=1 Tax=Curvularia clavata TaxID=95742 RepID=A0A9Q8ZFX0_CURCL|nr:hypothetical protein yc1106_06732 [Curvularia clavata]